MINKKIVN